MYVTYGVRIQFASYKWLHFWFQLFHIFTVLGSRDQLLAFYLDSEPSSNLSSSYSETTVSVLPLLQICVVIAAALAVMGHFIRKLEPANHDQDFQEYHQANSQSLVNTLNGSPAVNGFRAINGLHASNGSHELKGLDTNFNSVDIRLHKRK